MSLGIRVSVEEIAVPLSPSERTLRARIAAETLHSKYDSRDLTEPARKSFMQRFEIQVDPNGELPEAERIRRAEHARRAYFQRLAFQSAKARRAKATGGEAA